LKKISLFQFEFQHALTILQTDCSLHHESANSNFILTRIGKWNLRLVDRYIIVIYSMLFVQSAVSDSDEPIHIINVAIKLDNKVDDQILADMFQTFCRNKVGIKIASDLKAPSVCVLILNCLVRALYKSTLKSHYMSNRMPSSLSNNGLILLYIYFKYLRKDVILICMPL